jgi:hypothetical protein
LRERKRAMSDVLADLSNAKDLLLDYCDRNRVATWVRDHPGIDSWVRERLGKAIAGWRPPNGSTGRLWSGDESSYLK